MIENIQYKISKADIFTGGSLSKQTSERLSKNAIRWYIAQVNKDGIVVETTVYSGRGKYGFTGTDRQYYPGKTAVLNIIPTGIGCNIGGYAGDAAPVTKLLASTADYLVTNTNAVNASDFINLDSNILYTDGHSIDLFTRGLVDLHIPYSNKIGLIIEKAANEVLDIVFNVVNAVRAIYGVTIVDYEITEGPIGGRCVENEFGAFVGTIDNPSVLLNCCERLIAKGANAIAVTSNIKDLPLDNYAKHFSGNYPNPVGGAEAIISYLIANQFQLPAAHAPILNVKQLNLGSKIIDARGAGEMASESGLACILAGLRRAPQTNARAGAPISDIVNIHNLISVVGPADSLGGIPIIYAQDYNIPIIAVKGNTTVLNVTRSRLPLKNVIKVSNYAEAAGIILGLRKGLSIESLSRPLSTLRY